MRTGDEEVLKFIIADMVYEQIRDMDFDYEKVVKLKAVKIVGAIYNELRRNIPDDIKLSNIYEIFDNYGILVSLDITSEDNNGSNV